MMRALILTIMMIANAFVAAPVMAQDEVSDRDTENVLALLAALDDLSQTAEEMLDHYTDDVVILPPGEQEVRGKEALLEHLSAFGAGVDLTIRHEPVEITSLDEIVVVRGRVVGTAQPEGDANIYPFETKNIILMRRVDDGLKIWKVIYNAAPVE